MISHIPILTNIKHQTHNVHIYEDSKMQFFIRKKWADLFPFREKQNHNQQKAIDTNHHWDTNYRGHPVCEPCATSSSCRHLAHVRLHAKKAKNLIPLSLSHGERKLTRRVYKLKKIPWKFQMLLRHQKQEFQKCVIIDDRQHLLEFWFRFHWQTPQGVSHFCWSGFVDLPWICEKPKSRLSARNLYMVCIAWSYEIKSRTHRKTSISINTG